MKCGLAPMAEAYFAFQRRRCSVLLLTALRVACGPITSTLSSRIGKASSGLERTAGFAAWIHTRHALNQSVTIAIQTLFARSTRQAAAGPSPGPTAGSLFTRTRLQPGIQ